MKNKVTELKWIVKNYDCNRNVIIDYNILANKEDIIKKLKKKCATKQDFAEELKRKLMSQYWSRAEYELVIRKTDDGHVFLYPWCSCRNPKETEICVDNDDTFDWKSFAEEHIYRDNEAKIDIYDQIMFSNQFEKLVDYCWYTRLKYERNNPKFNI